MSRPESRRHSLRCGDRLFLRFSGLFLFLRALANGYGQPSAVVGKNRTFALGKDMLFFTSSVPDAVKVKGVLFVHAPDIKHEPLAVMGDSAVSHVQLLPLTVIRGSDGLPQGLLFAFAFLAPGRLGFLFRDFRFLERSGIFLRGLVGRSLLIARFSRNGGGQEEDEGKGDGEEGRVKPHVTVCKGERGLLRMGAC